jgi:alpha-amylase
MRAIAYSAYLERRHRVRDGYRLAHYLSSHDEPLFLHELGGDVARFRLCVATQMATLGIPVIYYGEEVGRKGSVWPTNRNDMPWGDRDVEPGAGVPRDEALRDWYQRLIALRRAHPALSRGTYTRLHADGDLLVFRREDAGSGDAAVVAVNRGQTPAEVVVAIEGWAGGIVEGLSGEAVAVTGEGLRVQVPGLGVRIYLAADRRAE